MEDGIFEKIGESLFGDLAGGDGEGDGEAGDEGHADAGIDGVAVDEHGFEGGHG